MKIIKILALCLALLCFAACGADKAEIPEPAALYDEIKAAVELAPMSDVAEYMLEADTGITADEYSAAVYYILDEGTAPDQIIIVKAKDAAAADAVEQKLKGWLTYQEEGAQVYMTENMPLFQNGIVRRNGQTLSLIVSSKAEEIAKVYDRYK